MIKQVATRKSLMEKVRDGDGIGWEEFYKAYAGLIWTCGRDAGIPPSDCEDLIQQVMLAFFQAQRSFCYDRGKGRFKNYLRRIIRSQQSRMFEQYRKRGVSVPGGEEIPVDDEDRWEKAWRLHLVDQAMEILRVKMEPAAYQAFSLCVLDGLNSGEVAARLGMKPDTVYVIKSRGMAMLRQTVGELENHY